MEPYQAYIPTNDALRRFRADICVEAHQGTDSLWTPVIVMKMDTIYGEELDSTSLEPVDTADHALRHGLKFLAKAIRDNNYG